MTAYALATCVTEHFDTNFFMSNCPVDMLIGHVEASKIRTVFRGAFVPTQHLHAKLIPFRDVLADLLNGRAPKSLGTHDIIEFVETHVRSVVKGTAKKGAMHQKPVFGADAMKCYSVTINEYEQKLLTWHIQTHFSSCSALPELFETAVQEWRKEIINGITTNVLYCDRKVHGLVTRAVNEGEKLSLEAITDLPFKLQLQYICSWS